MDRLPPDCRNLPRLPISPDSVEALLRALGSPSPWPAFAAQVLRDPIATCQLLALYDARGPLREGLTDYLADLSERIGRDILQAWLLCADTDDGASSTALAQRACRTADFARRAALAQTYPFPDEAYLGGLLRSLSPLWATVGRTGRAPPGMDGPLRPPALPALSLPLRDALCLPDHWSAEQRGLAHPLIRIVELAARLAEGNVTAIDAFARSCGIPPETVDHLRDQEAIAAPATTAPPRACAPLRPIETTAALPASATIGMATPTPLLLAALDGLLAKACADTTTTTLRLRYRAACQLIAGCSAPLALISLDGRQLVGAEFSANEEIITALGELALRLDDEASGGARAARIAIDASVPPAALAGEPRSPHDAHLAAWLDLPQIHCVPVPGVGVPAAAICAPGPDTAASPSLAPAITAAMLSSWLNNHRREAHQRAERETAQAQMREHTRRLVHEARNPLTVIKNYLGVMQQQLAHDGDTGRQLALLDDELERLAGLLARTAQGPEANIAEPAQCRLAPLLHDLRTLYGAALFTSRGIQFDMRTAPSLPPLAIPASVLKQVLLNLYKNASEALHPGGRFSVVAPGTMLANGRNCVELRVIDNGPGLPQARLDDLTLAGASTKGSTHQGLGLAIVFELLQKWDAHLLCRSQNGTGTSFQILVPVYKSV